MEEKKGKPSKGKAKIIAVVVAVIVAIAAALVVTQVVIPAQEKAAQEKAEQEAREAQEKAEQERQEAEKKAEQEKAQAESLAAHEKLKDATVGGTVFYGTYEQDNDTSNGPEDIEWVVLKKDGSDLLLLSKNILDHKKFSSGTTSSGKYWNQSELKKWLEGDFKSTAFSSGESGRLSKSHSDDGEIFALSYDELKEYLPKDDDQAAKTTAYCRAVFKELNGNAQSGLSTWWLRTASTYRGVFYVMDIGDVNYTFPEVTRGVRPAIWVMQ